MISHMVYFSLKDPTDANVKKVVDSCKKHLTGHEGGVFFAAGGREKKLEREVNDKDFDVALNLVFRDMAAHDQYQEHPRHKEFIDECKDLWKSVRVFDAVVESK